VDATHSLPGPARSTTPTDIPYLPPSEARQAPKLEKRTVDIDLSAAHRPRHTSMRAYVTGFVGLAVVSVAGWFALGEYIYG
jgi:hypothetical protein